MTVKFRFFVLIMLIFSTMTSEARRVSSSGVHIIGNGADVVVCQSEDEETYDLLDTYEISKVYNLPKNSYQLRFNTLKVLRLYLERIKEVDREFYSDLRDIVSHFYNACSLGKSSNQVISVDDEDKMLGELLQCEVHQLAFQWPKSDLIVMQDSCPVEIDHSLLNKLSSSDKAAFYLHESLIHYIKLKRAKKGFDGALHSTELIRVFVGLTVFDRLEFIFSNRDKSLVDFFKFTYLL